jgi:hypothetical protein
MTRSRKLRRRVRNDRPIEWSVPLVGSLFLGGFFVVYIIAAAAQGKLGGS